MNLVQSKFRRNILIVTDARKESLRKSEIIRGHKSIENILKAGGRYQGKDISIFFLPGAQVRVGFIVSRKYKKAVIRNRIRRLMREVYRRNKKSFVSGISLLYCKHRNRLPTYHELTLDILDTLEKIKGR